MKPYSSQLVESLQNWKDLGTDNTSRLIKALELYSNAIPVTESEFLQQPKSLLEQVIIAVIMTDNISLDKIKKYIYDNVEDEKTKEDLVEVSNTQLDLKRVKTNHDIINKRFNLDSMNSYLTDAQREFPQLAMIPICKLLDTYSLSLQDKFALMVEELLYLSIKYNHNATCSNYNAYIIPTVHSYLFSMYPTAEIPGDIVAKVQDSIIEKLDASKYIRNNSDKEYKENEAAKIIAKFEVSDGNTGDARCKDNLCELFHTLGTLVVKPRDIDSIGKIVLPLFYQYFVVANYFDDDADLYEVIHDFNAGQFENNVPDTTCTDYVDCHSRWIELLETFLSGIRDENSIAIDTLREYIVNLKECRDSLLAANDYELEDEPYDVNDAPTDIFTDYDNAVLDDIEELDGVFWSNVLDDSTIETFTNKDILKSADKDLLDFIEESYEKHYPRISKTKLILSLNEAVREVRKEKTTPETITKIAHLKDIVYKVKNYHDDNQDDMKDICNDAKVMSGNIIKDSNQNDMMKTYTASVLGKLYNEDTVLVNNIAKQAMHEMKLSSYVTLGLDKLKEGITKLSDAQKNACMQIDRFADTIERLNDEDDRKEARMQVVKNSFLPSMSRCIKSIILAGALAVLVNPFLGLVALVVRFVNSKRATKEERQAVADEIEVELEMLDRRIRDAEDEKDYKKERKLRLLKRKLITYLSKLAVNNATKWNNEVMLKKDIDDAGSEFGVKD